MTTPDQRPQSANPQVNDSVSPARAGFGSRLRSAIQGVEQAFRGRRPADSHPREDGPEADAAIAGDEHESAPPELVPAPAFVAAVAIEPSAPTRLTVSEEVVAYKLTSVRALNIHVVRPAGTDPASGRPCLLFFHGGGWRRGSAQQFLPYCRLLAQRGIVGMSAEYRLLDGEEDEIPVDAVADARSAMRWVRQNARRFGCDPARIGAGGGSSGAHLAVMTAMKSSVDDVADDLGVDPRPAALVLMNPPCNFDGYASAVPIAARRLYSPYHLVDDSLPPTLMLHGTADKVIPFSQITDFQERARSVGVKQLKVVPFEGRGHGFFNRGKGEPGDFMRSAQEMGGFLRGLGWL